jgi:hypothetical protein
LAGVVAWGRGSAVPATGLVPTDAPASVPVLATGAVFAAVVVSARRPESAMEPDGSPVAAGPWVVPLR